MEVFSNLLWAALVLALGTAWLVALHRRSEESLLPRAGLQLITLTILAAILLPVISLTDDLQAWTAPAEGEHLSLRRGDLQASHERDAHRMPVALALLTAPFSLSEPHPAGRLAANDATPRIRGSLTHSLPTRAPPAAWACRWS